MAKGKSEYWRSDKGKEQLTAWARNGLTEEELAKNMQISRSTLALWCKKYSDISDTLKNARTYACARVENSLFQKATGQVMRLMKPVKIKHIEYDENGKKKKEWEEIEMAPEEVYYPPDVAAQIFWLKNRVPDKWKDKVITEEDERAKIITEIKESEAELGT